MELSPRRKPFRSDYPEFMSARVLAWQPTAPLRLLHAASDHTKAAVSLRSRPKEMRSSGGRGRSMLDWGPAKRGMPSNFKPRRGDPGFSGEA